MFNFMNGKGVHCGMDIEQRFNYKIERQKKQITLTEIAKHIGCSSSLLSKWEYGKCEISDRKIKKYIEYISN